MNLNELDYKNILFSPIFSKIIITLIIIIVGIIIGRVFGKVIQGILHELGLDNLFQKSTKMKVSLEKIFSNFVSYFIYFITIIMALTQLGLTTTALNILIAAMAVILVISIFFIIKDFFPNIIAGIFIQKKDFIKEGDYIKIDEKEGEVINTNLIEIIIKTKEGEIVYVPNSILTKKVITKTKVKE